MLEVKAQCYSFEAANVRHEHEWRLWETTKLPDGKMILPGVVSHSTNLIEHPDLIADRIMRFAKLVGRENVIAGTDCGLGGRVHAEIAWAKLGALAEGAKLASKRLWSLKRRVGQGALAPGPRLPVCSERAMRHGRFDAALPTLRCRS